MFKNYDHKCGNMWLIARIVTQHVTTSIINLRYVQMAFGLRLKVSYFSVNVQGVVERLWRVLQFDSKLGAFSCETYSLRGGKPIISLPAGGLGRVRGAWGELAAPAGKIGWLVGWLVEQGLTSHSTQFRSFRRRCFYRSDDPTNSVKALKEGG